MSAMRTSNVGKQAIKNFEGCRLESYLDAANIWTIGYGTTRTATGPVTAGMRITESQAQDFFESDLRAFEQAVNEAVTVPLTQPQFDAIVSWTYNVGIGAMRESTLVRKLNQGDYEGAAEEFSRWNIADGKVNEGLIRRRAAERALFLSQPAGATPLASSSQAASSPAAPVPAPAAPEAKETYMPLPALIVAAASALLPVVADLFHARGSRTSERNADIVEAAAPVLLEVAKAVVPGAANEQAAAEAILNSKALQDQYRAAVALKWSDVAPAFEFDAAERDKARAFTAQMTGEGPLWRQAGWGALIAILSLLIVGGIGYTFWHVLFSDAPAFSQSTRDGVVELMKNVLILVVGFYFGSSASGRQKDQIISDQSKR